MGYSYVSDEGRHWPPRVVILGAGVTGLAAGMVSGCQIYEALQTPGGICSSYGASAASPAFTSARTNHRYLFEKGGGHWLFGGDPVVLRFVRSMVELKEYEKKAGVFFARDRTIVPFPLQSDPGFKQFVRAEGYSVSNCPPRTMAAAMRQKFGDTLCKVFFDPFNEAYTAGLYSQIAPQDSYKSPSAGQMQNYNSTFYYPTAHLDTLTKTMAQRCRVSYGKQVVSIDASLKKIYFTDRTHCAYDAIISTLPLNQMISLAGITVRSKTDPYTSVLVLNIGAVRGKNCPDSHWLYVPESESKFHRVGFYSNVDRSFLPAETEGRVSLYVERSFRGGSKPTREEVSVYQANVVRELKDWGFIEQAEVVSPSWIDVAYTWSHFGSLWKSEALNALQNHGIYQVGRYGRWIFQGILDSIKDGLMIGSAFRDYPPLES